MAKVKRTDTDHALYPASGSGRAFNRKEAADEYGEGWWVEVEGWVETPNGFVRAYSFYWDRKRGKVKRSGLQMIKDGRCYYREFSKAYTQRGLVTKAKQFAAELYEVL